MIPSPNSPRVKVNEYRTDSNGSEVDALKLESAAMLTRGYETVPLFFHPYYRDGSAFRYLGRETTGAKNHVIAFAQIPDKARLSGKIESFGILFRFFLQGFVWVDPTTYQILRMRTDLLSPLFEAGLTRQTSIIDLAQVRFDETGLALWLPHEVTVYSEFMGQNFRNRHQYSQYRLFTVDAKEGNRQSSFLQNLITRIDSSVERSPMVSWIILPKSPLAAATLNPVDGAMASNDGGMQCRFEGVKLSHP